MSRPEARMWWHLLATALLFTAAVVIGLALRTRVEACRTAGGHYGLYTGCQTPTGVHFTP